MLMDANAQAIPTEGDEAGQDVPGTPAGVGHAGFGDDDEWVFENNCWRNLYNTACHSASAVRSDAPSPASRI